IDDAVVDIDNIMRHVRAHRSQDGGRSPAALIFEACLETRSPLLYATVILVLAAVPFFLLHGATGAFFGPLALSYTAALLASMVVAVTVTPVLAYVLLRGASSRHHEPSIIRPLQHRYDAAASRITHASRLAFLISGAAVLAGLAILPLLSWSLLPAFKERDI